MKQKKFTFLQKRGNRLLMTKDCFRHHVNMEYQKITNLLGYIPDKVPRFITKKWIEVHDDAEDDAEDDEKPINKAANRVQRDS